MQPPNWIILAALVAVLVMAYAAGRVHQWHHNAGDISAATLHGYRNGIFDAERRQAQALAHAARTGPASGLAGASNVGHYWPVSPTAPAPRHAREPVSAGTDTTLEFRPAA
jgi:hypothetical protein